MDRVRHEANLFPNTHHRPPDPLNLLYTARLKHGVNNLLIVYQWRLFSLCFLTQHNVEEDAGTDFPKRCPICAHRKCLPKLSSLTPSVSQAVSSSPPQSSPTESKRWIVKTTTTTTKNWFLIEWEHLLSCQDIETISIVRIWIR